MLSSFQGQTAETPHDSFGPSSTHPAISGILSAFDTYEVVGISAAHEMKDVDDLILSLVRSPAFSKKVNDIVVECGNMRYQTTLDRYIAGDAVPFSEVQQVWRNTTQPMCGQSGFFEQLFPLIRSLNKELPASRQLRVIAADPPIDWELIHQEKDIAPFMERDENIASVMEREVLSKQRKALMLFGIFHLLHTSGPGQGNAVTIYERHYPGKTFVISDLGYFGSDPGDPSTGDFAKLEIPSLIRTKGSPLGAMSLKAFLPSPLTTDDQCNVIDEFGGGGQKVVADLIDAFLYLGPQTLRLRETVPSDIALDRAYMQEWIRRNAVAGLPGPKTMKELDDGLLASAADPLLLIPKLPDTKELYPLIRNACLARKAHSQN